MNKEVSTESVVKNIRCGTHRKYSSEGKICVVLEGLKGEQSISSLCCRESISKNLYYRNTKVAQLELEKY